MNILYNHAEQLHLTAATNRIKKDLNKEITCSV